jgi:diacylglycerol kinase family enzyme
MLSTGEVRAIDVGLAADRPFFEAGSVGISAAIFAEAQRIDEGQWDGLLGLFRAVLRYRPRRMELQLDDESVRTRAMMVVVANGPYTGIGLAFAPHARLDDGRFDVVMSGQTGKMKFLANLPKVFKGTHVGDPHIELFRARELQVDAERPFRIYADGDPIGATPATIRAVPGALRVLAPAS